jgi:glycosyltransferase involved in cell wall biosynthesis
MPHDPLVAAIMLTKDRPEMAVRAVRAFREQTYGNKMLFVMDNGKIPLEGAGDDFTASQCAVEGKSIGALRNFANTMSGGDILIHWDDDDVSHPNRIAEQVAHLQASGADVVGYSELLFWRTVSMVEGQRWDWVGGQAWLFKNAHRPPGTSLCYWRKTWERKPFPDTSEAEDRKWCMGLNVASVSCIHLTKESSSKSHGYATIGNMRVPEPRLIASIHGGNTADYDLEAIIARGGHTNWKRTPEWDSYCREKMAL